MAQSRFTENAPAATDPSGEIHGIVGTAEPMLEVYRMVARVAPTTSTVLIQERTAPARVIARPSIQQPPERPPVPVDAARS